MQLVTRQHRVAQLAVVGSAVLPAALVTLELWGRYPSNAAYVTHQTVADFYAAIGGEAIISLLGTTLLWLGVSSLVTYIGLRSLTWGTPETSLKWVSTSRCVEACFAVWASVGGMAFAPYFVSFYYSYPITGGSGSYPISFIVVYCSFVPLIAFVALVLSRLAASALRRRPHSTIED